MFVGSLSGAGADIANFVSYNEAQRWVPAEKAKEYGTGIKGVIDADASNNATQGGALIPTLTLGIPGSGSSAALLGALAIHGLNPGPNLFQHSGPIVYAMILSLFLSNVLIIVYGLSGARVFGKLRTFRSAMSSPSWPSSRSLARSWSGTRGSTCSS